MPLVALIIVGDIYMAAHLPHRARLGPAVGMAVAAGIVPHSTRGSRLAVLALLLVIFALDVNLNA